MANRGTGGGIKLYTPQTLQAACDAYLADCKEKGRRATRPGLCLALDISDDTLLRYEAGGGQYGEVAGPIKRCVLAMRDELEQGKDAMSIFALKQKGYGGYTDKGDLGGGVCDVRISFGADGEGKAGMYGK